MVVKKKGEGPDRYHEVGVSSITMAGDGLHIWFTGRDLEKVSERRRTSKLNGQLGEIKINEKTNWKGKEEKRDCHYRKWQGSRRGTPILVRGSSGRRKSHGKVEGGGKKWSRTYVKKEEGGVLPTSRMMHAGAPHGGGAGEYQLAA